MRFDKDRISHFSWWCQKVLPLVYDDSLSYYEVLCKLTEWVKEVIKYNNSLSDFLQQIDTDMDNLQDEWEKWTQDEAASRAEWEEKVNAQLTEVADLLEGLKNGEMPELWLEAMKTYIDQNLQNMVAGMAKYVVFGLSTDGHFCAYIPKAWDFIEFSTINDPDSELYNHLVLHW